MIKKNYLPRDELEGEAVCRLDFSLKFQISSLMPADVAVCNPCNCSTSAVFCRIGINAASLIDVITKYFNTM